MCPSSSFGHLRPLASILVIFLGMAPLNAPAQEKKADGVPPAPAQGVTVTPPAVTQPVPSTPTELPKSEPLYQPSAPGFELSKYVKFDGQLRIRYEYFDPFSYTTAGVNQADDAVFLRTRLGALFTLHPRLSARVQIQDSRIWGEEGAATGSNPVGSVTTSIDNVDVHQAYVDLKSLFEDALGKDTLTLRAGRQELSYGDQRLVSPLDWSNVARAWDAARLMITPARAPFGFKVDVFASIVRDTVSLNTGGGPTGVSAVDEKQEFHGVYATFDDIRVADEWGSTDESGKLRPYIGRQQVDLYTFYRRLADDAFASEDGSTGDLKDVTLGARLAGKVLESARGGGFDYTGELAYQTGSFAGDEVRAYGLAVTGGYTFACACLGATKLRLGSEFDYGSGDHDPDDNERGTFDPLFPFGHQYQGIQDTFSWKNGQDLAFKAEIFPPKWTQIPNAEVQYHFFWLSDDHDGWFNAALAQIRRDSTGNSRNFVGQEVDVLFKYVLIDPFAVVWLGYSHFFPGDFVRDTGSHPDRDFVFAQLGVTF